MNVRRFKTVACVVLVLAVSLFITAGVYAQQPKQEKFSFSIVTGGTGGVWYPLGGAIGGVIGKYVPNTEATSEATTAAIDNMKLLVAGKAGTGLRLRLSHRLGERRQGTGHPRQAQDPAGDGILRAAAPYRNHGRHGHHDRDAAQGQARLRRRPEQRHGGAGRLRTQGTRHRLEQGHQEGKARGQRVRRGAEGRQDRRLLLERRRSRPAPSSTWPPPPASRWCCCRWQERRRTRS